MATLGRMRAAKRARKLLDDYQIDINSAENGIPLPKDQHAGSLLHTNETQRAIAERLEEARDRAIASARNGSDWVAERDSILTGLDNIRREIASGRFPPGLTD